jgi:hypothetical protein
MNSKLNDSNCKMFIRLFYVYVNYNHSLSAHINFMPRLEVSLGHGLFINKKIKRKTLMVIRCLTL